MMEISDGVGWQLTVYLADTLSGWMGQYGLIYGQDSKRTR